MAGDDLIYRKLQRHLDRMAVGFPESKSGAEIKILEEMFNTEEAEIAIELSMLPEPASKVFPRVKHFIGSVEELENKLDKMFSKGLIFGGKILSDDPDRKLYSNAYYIIGMHEMHVNNLTKNMMINTIDYALNTYYKEYNRLGIPAQMRTVPVQKSIIRNNYTATYDDIKALIQNSKGSVLLINCVCKQGMDLVGIPCKVTEHRETCMVLNVYADSFKNMVDGKSISKEEALSLVNTFEEKGLIIQPENNRNPEYICFCCGCCCGILNMLKRFPKPAEYYVSNYYATVDTEVCVGCGTCGTRCQMSAVSINEEKAVIDLDRCIGCGLCTSTCKTGAMALNRKTGEVTPPKDHNDLYKKIFMKKVGPFSAIKTMIKYKLGMKV